MGALNGFLKTGERFLSKHSNKLLAAVAIAAEAFGMYLIHKKAPIVRQKLDELPEDSSWIDKIKVAGPIYLPAIGMFVLSGSAVIGSCAAGEKRIADITQIAMMSQAALTSNEQQLIEAVGPEKAQEMHDKAAADLMKSRHVSSDRVVYTGHGNDLFYDELCDRVFASSREYIMEGVAKVNAEITGGTDLWASVNDFYDAIDLKRVKLANNCGWNVDHRLKIGFAPDFTDDGHPCAAIVYYEYPRLYNGKDPVNIH